MQKDTFRITLGYIFICLLWGSTWMVIKIGLDSLTPLFSAGVRFLFAAILIYLIMRVRGFKLQSDKASMRLYVSMSFLSFSIPFGMVYWAEQFIPTGLTSVLFAVYPFFIIIFSKMFIPKEQIGIYKIVGTVAGFVGIYIIFSSNLKIDLENQLWGMIAVFSAAAIQASNTVIIKKWGTHLNSFTMIFIPLLIAGFSMILASVLFEDLGRLEFTFNAVFSIAYLAIFGTIVTFTIYYWLLKTINVVILSLSSFIIPIIAVLFGWIFLKEYLTLNDLLGSSLVLIGILFANFTGLKNYIKMRLNRQND